MCDVCGVKWVWIWRLGLCGCLYLGIDIERMRLGRFLEIITLSRRCARRSRDFAERVFVWGRCFISVWRWCWCVWMW